MKFNRLYTLQYLLLLPIITVAFGCKQHNCGKFWTGKFTMELPDGRTDTIRRWAHLQTERVDTMKVADTLLVKWVDSCTYTLTPTPYNMHRHPLIPPNTVLTVKIEETYHDYYKSITTANTGNMQLKDKITKISDSY